MCGKILTWHPHQRSLYIHIQNANLPFLSYLLHRLLRCPVEIPMDCRMLQKAAGDFHFLQSNWWNLKIVHMTQFCSRRLDIGHHDLFDIYSPGPSDVSFPTCVGPSSTENFNPQLCLLHGLNVNEIVCLTMHLDLREPLGFFCSSNVYFTIETTPKN